MSAYLRWTRAKARTQTLDGLLGSHKLQCLDRITSGKTRDNPLSGIMCSQGGHLILGI